MIKFLTKKSLHLKLLNEDWVDSLVKESVKSFRMGQEFLEDDARPAWPVEVITENKMVLVEKLVLSDRRLIIKKMKEVIQLSDTTVHWILLDYLSMRGARARWIPKHLSAV